MKINKLFIALATAVLATVSCVKESGELQPYPRNTGDEYLTVSAEALEFLGRGGTMTFDIEASYDGTVVAPEWITLTSTSFPGDKRSYTMRASTEANKSGSDREGKIVISTPTIKKEITVSQPNYFRPESPASIANADDLVYWLETCAAYCETGELMEFSADIDMKGVKIKPAEYFVGILDGCGHKIKNLEGDCPLITKNEGVIDNLIIDESCKYVVPVTTAHFGPFAGDNYGTIANCQNHASITLAETNPEKIYIGGITGYSQEGSMISGCHNYGAIRVDGIKTTVNFYLGGMAGYAYGDFVNCENSGEIDVDVVDIATAQIFFGGMAPRLENGTVKGCINHKEAKITVAGTGKSGNIYGGGIVGYHEGASDIRESSNFADVEVTLNNGNNYIGGILGWQAKVTSAPFTILEGCVVNTNMTGYKACKPTNGGYNPTESAGLVLGRFSGQANNQICNIGSDNLPIKVSGSVYCVASNVKVVANAKNCGVLADGDGSATNYNDGASTWQVFHCAYEVVGDGQTGPAEDLIVSTDPIKLEVPMAGGSATFNVKSNYDATVRAEADWLSFSETEPVQETIVAGDESEQTITIYAQANPKTQTREGKVTISLPMGTYKEVTITQAGNTALPGSLTVSPESIEMDPVGGTATIEVTANFEARMSSDVDWLSFSPETVPGDETPHKVTVTATKNNGATAADRTATITVALPADKALEKTISVSQAKFVYIPKEVISNVDDFMDFVEYGSDPDLYPAGFTVSLGADIDLKGKALSPVSTFVATFDGQGHSLKNWACEGPLFGAINGGVVKGLVIDSSCTVGLKFENATPNGSNNCIGVICGDLLKGSIENCTNNANVTLVTFGTANTFIGTIAGRSSANVMIKGCVNNGSVSIKPQTAGASYRVGGIVGGSNGNVQDCTNNAPVEYAPAEVTGGNHFVGGVAAYLAKNTDQTFYNCVNTQKGKVTFDPAKITSIAQSYVGGALAYLDGQLKADTNFSNVKNFGDVCSTAANELVAVGGLLGWANSGGTPNNFLWNSAVNCNVTAAFASVDGSAVNPCQSAGLVIGRVKLSSGAANVTAVCGSAEEPVKVSGSVTLLGGATVTATVDNYLDLAKGSGFADTNNKFVFNGVFQTVAKE